MASGSADLLGHVMTYTDGLLTMHPLHVDELEAYLAGIALRRAAGTTPPMAGI